MTLFLPKKVVGEKKGKGKQASPVELLEKIPKKHLAKMMAICNLDSWKTSVKQMAQHLGEELTPLM